MITGLYAALLALFQVFLTYRIVPIRMKEKVSLGSGGSEALETAVRSHGNFVETVPMALFLMILIEFGNYAFFGYKAYFLHAMGILMILGRLSHFYGLNTPPGYGAHRRNGMVLTFLVYILGAAGCLAGFLL